MTDEIDDDEPTGEPEQQPTPAEHAAARQQPDPGGVTIEEPDDGESTNQESA